MFEEHSRHEGQAWQKAPQWSWQKALVPPGRGKGIRGGATHPDSQNQTEDGYGKGQKDRNGGTDHGWRSLRPDHCAETQEG